MESEFSFSRPEIIAEDGKFYDYFLPSGAPVDEDSVLDAMLDDEKNIAFFLNLAEGNVEKLDMKKEENRKIYQKMNSELFAYAQTPRVELNGDFDEGGLMVAYRQFVESLPVNVKKIEAEFEDENLFDENCDCAICSLESACSKEGRSPTMQELEKAFAEQNEKNKKNGL